MSEVFVARERVREDLRDLVPYDTHPYPNVVRMDLNENPFPFPEAVVKEIMEGVEGDTFTRYPDPNATLLRRALGRYNNENPEKIIVGNGSDELIQLIYLAFGGDQRTVLIPTPTFSMFKIHARITGTQVEQFPLTEGFKLPIEEFLEKAGEVKADIIVMVTPNNPTGTVIPQKDLVAVLEQSSALVVIDEAYFEFNRETVAGLLENYPNLIVLRTFSKAFGLAGMRVGYLIANTPVVAELNKIKQPFNVNSFSQLAARTALNHIDSFSAQINEIIDERERMFSALDAFPGLEVFPSQSNFILFRTPIKSEIVYNKLLKSGILIRDLGSSPGLTDCLRVTIGKKEENVSFLQKLAGILEEN